MNNERRFVGLVVAAGFGMRFGGNIPKQYQLVLGQPIIYHSILALSSHPEISEINVVLAPDDQLFRSFDWDQLEARIIPWYVGGRSRAESVKKGLMALSCQDKDWVVIHDAARPCLAQPDLDKMVSYIRKNNIGVVLAKRVSDTIKKSEANSSRVIDTIPREDLWHALTPQIFEYYVLQQALQEELTPDITDESFAVERLGINPILIESGFENPKVTFNSDLQFTELILKNRKNLQ